MDAQTVGNLITALTPVVVPLAVAAVKPLLAQLPKVAVPFVAIVLGAAIDLVNAFVTGNAPGLAWGAALGAAGIGVREVLDQARNGLAKP